MINQFRLIKTDSHNRRSGIRAIYAEIVKRRREVNVNEKKRDDEKKKEIAKAAAAGD